jgi:ParB-like chromosome segregation protein Spo0J
MNELIKQLTAELTLHLEQMYLPDKVDALNYIRKELHHASPFKTEPVDLVQWVRNDTVKANQYNPNHVHVKEMELLKLSISADGYTQPIVSMVDPSDDMREVIDGFHRHKVGKFDTDIQARIHGYLPVVTINSDRQDLGDRMSSTIRHNRARGTHAVDKMSDIVLDLKKRNWSDEKIAKNLGMDADEVLRLGQISGLAEMFAHREFSEAWESEGEEIEGELIEE